MEQLDFGGAAIDIPYVFTGKSKYLNLEICNIFTWPLSKAMLFIIITLVPERNTMY